MTLTTRYVCERYNALSVEARRLVNMDHESRAFTWQMWMRQFYQEIAEKQEGKMDWDDPVARHQLIERVGPDEYERQLQQHMKDSVIEVVMGYEIRLVKSAFGPLYMVHGLRRGHQSLEGARKIARGEL